MFVLDSCIVKDWFSGAPISEEVRHLMERGRVALCVSYLPEVERHLRERNPDALDRFRAVLKEFPLLKAPSYIDHDSPLAQADMGKYLVDLAARATGAHLVTTDEEMLALSPAALNPSAALQLEKGGMQFTDLGMQYHASSSEIERRMDDVFRHRQFIHGPEIRELEERCASFTGSRHGIGVSSGTDALLVALMACGIGTGDVVVTTPFTFIATAEVAALLGATPVFVDVDPGSCNISPAALDRFLEHPELPDGTPVAAERIKAVVAVDLYGLPADYGALRDVLAKHGSAAALVEDGAQSFGATFGGRKACSFGDISTTSFFPAKPFGCYGDGGMVFTDSDELAARMRVILNHGQKVRYSHQTIGLNARLDTLQAACLLAKFETFARMELTARRQVASWYREELQNVPELVLPPRDIPGEGTESAWAQFTIRVADRDRLMAALKDVGIPYAIHYPKPLHLQEAFESLGYRNGAFPVAEAAADSVISLPMDAWKTRIEVAAVAAAVRKGIA